MKEEVRNIAEKIGLVNAKKKDSVGLCFVGLKEKKFSSFLANYLSEKQGKVLDFENKKEVGEHKGVYFYTIGQRRGFFLSNSYKTPFYIVGKDIKKNLIYVVNGFENEQLYSYWCIVVKMNWLVNFKEIKNEKNITAKFRYQQVETEVEIFWNEEQKRKILKLSFKTKIKAVTPGQYAVLYSNDVCLGGGIIKETSSNDIFNYPKEKNIIY